ncbi:MAG: sigma 54-interacting transcriptional regulator [Planctomycetota bacterium]
MQQSAQKLPEGFLGPSRFSRELRERLPRVAASRAPVLLEGETGVGKSTLARAIHSRSPRAARSFQLVDCSSIPESILTRELFGHRHGAFTGAVNDEPGYLEAAEGGSVYLRGVDRLPWRGQTVLLRAFEEGEILPIGASRPLPVDLRFIESSQAPLEQWVREGSFREDLFYRLNGLRIEVPPLRERPEDLAFLIERFLRAEARRMRRGAPRIRDDLRRVLLAYPWPGNLLELRHTLQGWLAVEDAEVLTPAHLPAQILARLEERGEQPSGTRTFSIPAGLPFRRQLSFFQTVLLKRCWRECEGDREKLLRRLELTPHQLRYLQRKLDLGLG